jgi:hypothetical protein
MLSNHLYPIPQREPLIGIISYRRIHCSVPDRNARRCGNHPSNMLIRSVPHLDPEGEIAWDEAVMGWFDCHRWEFTIGKLRFGLPMDDDWRTEPSIEAAKARLRDVLNPRKTSTSICRISSTLPFRHTHASVSKGCWQIDRAALRRVLERLDGDETRLPPGLMSALEAKRTCWDGVMT